MVNHLMWIVSAGSLAGTVLNLKKKAVCFKIWAVCNVLWAVYDISIGAYAQASLQTVYVGLALWGIYEWRKKSV